MNHKPPQIIAAATIAALALIAPACKGDTSAEVVASPTSTPLPPVPTATQPPPTTEPTPEPTEEPTPAVDSGVTINLPQLNPGPWTWPEQGMDTLTNDQQVLAMWTIIEFWNMVDEQGEAGLTLADSEKYDRFKQVHVAKSFSDRMDHAGEDFSDDSVIMTVKPAADSESGAMQLEICSYIDGDLSGTSRELYAFVVDTPIPKLIGWETLETLADGEKASCGG